ncbi:MAG: hypothetical protein KGZ83_19115 [Sulfuricella sp.]|nr:hypothetical protein [Sulfuricella sp.]
MKAFASHCLLWSATLLGCGAAWAEGDLQLSVGSEYTTGKYGSTENSEIWYVPVTGKYATGSWLLKLTVPYLRISGPANVVGMNGTMVPPAGMNSAMMPLSPAQATSRRTAEGVGDVIAAASYAGYENRAAGVLFDVTGKIKFATADSDQGLGTGANDYAIQGDISKQSGRWAAFASGGWKSMGNPPGVTFKNPWYASLGATYKVSSPTTLGMVYDHRSEILDGGAKVSEITLFLSQKISPTAKIQGYVLRGFAAASPDWGAGVMVSAGF